MAVSVPGRVQQTVENFAKGQERQLVRPAATSRCRSRTRPFRRVLFTRRAGVHVDFHAHRHFHNLRSLPTHQGPPKRCWHDARTGIETRLPPNVAQARNIDRQAIRMRPTPNTSLPDKLTSLLDKASKAADRRTPNRSVMLHYVNFTPQQSLSAVFWSPLAPSACCEAVGCPCIWRCASCEDAAVLSVDLFIVSVGGC